MQKLPKQGEFYYHFKHDPTKGVSDFAYQIVGIAVHSEDESLFVAYRPLYTPNHVIDNEGNFNIRPLTMFVENVTKSNYDGPRFRLIKDPEIIKQLSKL